MPSNTYAAEFLDLRIAIEKTRVLRYIMYYLGCNVPVNISSPNRIFVDDLIVIVYS